MSDHPFDVIIIGAGTAGSVLAEQLTASGKLGVLLIEAGGAPTSRFVSIPAGFAKLFKGDHDWNFESEPQAAVSGRRIFTPRGKMLGGSSNMNAMIHQWCHPADFDGWVEAGASGWGFEDVAPVLGAQEQWGGEGGGAGRGRHGPMSIQPNRNARAISHRFVEAARRVGLGSDEDYNGRRYQGAWIAELAHKNGKRFSAYDAYLKPAMRRSNLEVITSAHVTGLVFDGARVTGVRFLHAGAPRTTSGRGVVLAAGAYGSPQILMLSGIGPGAALTTMGLAVHRDVPEVGENLQDHPVLPLVFRTGSTDTLKRAESPSQLLSYLLFGRGMLASNGVEGFAFTQVRPGPVAAPDLELMFLPFEFRREFLEPPREHAFSIGSAVVAPRSRGRVRLRGPDPLMPPSIDPGLLSDPDGIDKSVLLAGVRLARRIAAASPLAELNAGELAPGAGVSSDQELLAFAATTLQTVYHPTSTCRTGSDPRSVVDPVLRVRGTEGLWIADASVMPAVPRGHPNAVVAMIAHRAAGWIEKDVQAGR
jgi:choline dehydrogenase